jgi:hypothetical protein
MNNQTTIKIKLEEGITQIYRVFDDEQHTTAIRPTFVKRDMVVDGMPSINSRGHSGYTFAIRNSQYFIHQSDAKPPLDTANEKAEKLLGDEEFVYFTGDVASGFLNICQQHADGDTNGFIFCGKLSNGKQWTYIVRDHLLVKHKA